MLTIEQANQILEQNFAAWVLDLRPTVETVEKSSARLRVPYSERLVRVGARSAARR